MTIPAPVADFDMTEMAVDDGDGDSILRSISPAERRIILGLPQRATISDITEPRASYATTGTKRWSNTTHSAPTLVQSPTSPRSPCVLRSLSVSFGIEKSYQELQDVDYAGEACDTESLSDTQSTAPCRNREFRHEKNARPGSFKAIMRTITSMYGREIYDEKLSELWAAAHEGEENPITYPAGWKRLLFLISAVLPYTIASLDDTIIATLIPVFIAQFEKPADIGWYASSYFLPFAILTPLLGKCYSLWKIKWFFLGALSLFLVGSVVCASARTSTRLIAGRAISGTGAAGILQGAMRVLGVALPPKQRIYMEATGAVIMGACTMAGPTTGGFIADKLGWEWAFWINVPTTAVSFIAIFIFFPNETPHTPLFKLPVIEKIMRLDPIGSSLLITSISLFIVVLQDYSYSLDFKLTHKDVGIAIVAGILFALFLAQEICIRPDLALIPRAMLRRRAVWSCCIMLFVLFAGFTNFVFFLSIFFQVVQGDSAGQSAINLLPYVISATICAAVVAFGATKLRYYNPFFMLGGLLFCIGAGFLSQIDDTVPFSTRVGFEILIGSGVGFLVLANVTPCHIDLPERDHAIANGLIFMSGALGASISLPSSSAIFNHVFTPGVQGLDMPSEYQFFAIMDPATIRQTVPSQYIPAIIGVLVQAVDATFTFGLICSMICALTTIVIPWKPIKVSTVGMGKEPHTVP